MTSGPGPIEMRATDDDGVDRAADAPPPRPGLVGAIAAVAAVIVAAVVVSAVINADRDRAAPVATDPARPRPTDAPTRLPDVADVAIAGDAAHAARCFTVAPNAEHLRTVFESVGGFDGLLLGTATGAFDVVTFDAQSPDRLLAAQRGGYGTAEHQDVNERWAVADGVTTQTAWDRSTPHDFVHHNTDGTVTMWVAAAAGDGVAPRQATVLDRSGTVLTTSAPLFADRFAVDAGTVFALTGGPDWYAPRDAGHRDLVADDGRRQVRLADGAAYGWIDVPAAGLLVAYPTDPGGTTAVWDSRTLTRLARHPLADREYQRVAVSADGAVAVGVTADGALEPLDLTTGRTGSRFGRVDVREVERPIVLSADGTVAFTVERSGTFSVWVVGDDEPVTTFAAGAGVPRWLPTSRSAARLGSVLSPDGTRAALRIDARPGTTVSWRVIDTDVAGWLARALPSGVDRSVLAETPPAC